MNEGEGSRTAAKEYNDAQQKFVQANKVAPAAQEAERAVDGPEGESLRQAEKIGKSRSAAPGPEK